MPTSSGEFVTANASRYLQQLCKHFAHKIEVSFDTHAGRCVLSSGVVTLAADDQALRAGIVSDSVEGLEQAQGVIDRHLERFAFREGFTNMVWTSGD